MTYVEMEKLQMLKFPNLQLFKFECDGVTDREQRNLCFWEFTKSNPMLQTILIKEEIYIQRIIVRRQDTGEVGAFEQSE